MIVGTRILPVGSTRQVVGSTRVKRAGSNAISAKASSTQAGIIFGYKIMDMTIKHAPLKLIIIS
jgi:hypothetical protein